MRAGYAVAVFHLGLVLALPASGEEPYRAGYLSLMTSGDPPVPVSVWYPTTTTAAGFEIRNYAIAAAPDAPAAPGRHRLVVISHGSRGSDLGHHDLAEYLARNGIVVAAPRHLGDSSDQPRSSGGQQFVTRPWQIVATLDAVLSDPRLRDIIDAGRVGIAGFSAGGYTALVIAGAKPRFELWLAHCADHPDDRELCEGMPPPGVPVPLPTGKLPEETRIRAAVAMAPLGVVFDAPGLATIGIPLRVYAAAHDQVLVNAWNAEHVSGCCHGRRRTRQCPAVTMFSWRPARRLRRRPRHSCASTHRASIAPPFTRRSTQRSWISSIALLALDDPGQKADSV